MSDKYIFKRTREDKYTIIPNALIADTRLSWESRGLLIYLLSKPRDWTIRKTDLERQSLANDFVVTRILDELQDHRYIYRERTQNDKGQFEWITYVFDEPIPQFPTDGKPPYIVSKDNTLSNTTERATKKDVLDAIVEYSKQGNGLEDFPADVVPYLDEFVKKFRRNPAKQEKAGWIKAVREWREMGVTPAHVSAMFDYCREKGTVIKSPFSITFAFDEIRNQKQEDWEWV